MSSIPRQAILESAAHTTSAASNIFKIDDCQAITIMVTVSAVSGTAPTLEMTVETTDEYAATAASNFAAVQRFPLINRADTYSLHVDSGFARHFRLNYVIAGTDPSFTFAAQFTRHLG